MHACYAAHTVVHNPVTIPYSLTPKTGQSSLEGSILVMPGDMLVCAILKLQSITSTFHSDCRHTNVDRTVLTMCVLTIAGRERGRKRD